MKTIITAAADQLVGYRQTDGGRYASGRTGQIPGECVTRAITLLRGWMDGLDILAAADRHDNREWYASTTPPTGGWPTE